MKAVKSGASHLRRVSAAVGLAVATVLGAGAARPSDASKPVLPLADSVTVADTDFILGPSLDSLAGLSGKLRARFVAPGDDLQVPVLTQLFGDSSARRPGVYAVSEAVAGRPFALITLRPFADKKNGRIGSYRIGSWPFERRTPSNPRYASPVGFIEVTPENQDTYVSEHFRLRDFLTKDQHAVWPKYLVLDERLLDKLELVMLELSRSGVPAQHLHVMSGFRTPQYNVKGVGAGGRASASRHQYGDAADVFVDNDRNGRLDDLNGDGRVNTADVAVMIAAVERVERAYPELVGGAGTYRANSAHGPFVHIDARGNRARW
ncbi:MAG TPA: hypothetical protein VK922_18775 [Gemmatimonadaceae bacterium]|nr:hypothetical protein [Gemmatimonadaceae bacterium]